MNLEQQCVSLYLATWLKELGVKQESYFVWYKLKENQEFNNFISESWQIDDSERFDTIAAYTAAELLALLPHHITTKEPEPYNSYRLYISGAVIVKNPEWIEPTRTHFVNYSCDTFSLDKTYFMGKYLTGNIWDENPANAFAKMLVYLYEQGLIAND